MRRVGGRKVQLFCRNLRQYAAHSTRNRAPGTDLKDSCEGGRRGTIGKRSSARQESTKRVADSLPHFSPRPSAVTNQARRPASLPFSPDVVHLGRLQQRASPGSERKPSPPTHAPSHSLRTFFLSPFPFPATSLVHRHSFLFTKQVKHNVRSHNLVPLVLLIRHWLGPLPPSFPLSDLDHAFGRDPVKGEVVEDVVGGEVEGEEVDPEMRD